MNIEGFSVKLLIHWINRQIRRQEKNNIGPNLISPIVYRRGDLEGAAHPGLMGRSVWRGGRGALGLLAGEEGRQGPLGRSQAGPEAWLRSTQAHRREAGRVQRRGGALVLLLEAEDAGEAEAGSEGCGDLGT